MTYKQQEILIISSLVRFIHPPFPKIRHKRVKNIIREIVSNNTYQSNYLKTISTNYYQINSTKQNLQTTTGEIIGNNTCKLLSNIHLKSYKLFTRK